MRPRLWLLLLTAGLAAGCDENACNIGSSAGVGALGACTAVGGMACAFTGWATLGLSCAAALGCGIAGAVGEAAQSACALCNEDQSPPTAISPEQLKSLTEQSKKGLAKLEALQRLGPEQTEKIITNMKSLSADEVKTIETQTGLARKDLTELGADLKRRYDVLIGKNNKTSAFQMAKLELMGEIMAAMKTNEVMKYLDQETKELIRTSSQKVLDSVKDVDRNIKRLSNQMKDLGKSLGTAIEVGTVQVSYHEDFQHFDIMSRTFEELERGTSGTIINNGRVTRFKNAVDEVYKGAEQTYYNFHTMVVGNRLGLKSIFEINTQFCKSKDYIVFVMNQLVQFYATAKAMDGRDLDPVKAEKFKAKMIAVNQKYIEACGCPAGQTPKRMSNLQLLVSQPAPKTSVGEFYNQIIADDTISRTHLKKLNLLFQAKPFDVSPRILTAIRSQPIEVLEMILNLANFDSFSTLPLLENKLICPADPELRQVVVGGSDTQLSDFDFYSLSSIELFPRPPSDNCSIPDLPQARDGPSLSLLSGGRLVVCGGVDGNNLDSNFLDSCISWVAGYTSWTPLHTMSMARAGHTAWTPPSLPDSIVLLGGYTTAAPLTAEIVPGGATFALRHSGWGACGIPDGETVILTGGAVHSFVTRYNVNGFVEELPKLPEIRFDHACAALPSSGALVVAGEFEGSNNSSVLTLLPGAAAWTPLASLPRALEGARASIVGGKMRVTGGYDGSSRRSEVLEYQPGPNQWLKIGNLQAGRLDHAVFSIGPNQLPCL